jgi:hypothetical protein
MRQPKLYQQIAALCANLSRAHVAPEWKERWAEELLRIENEMLPSGSGFDSGTRIHRERTDYQRITLTTSFHHMNDHGMYIYWTHHDVIVTPNLVHEFDIRVTGRNQRGIKDHIEEVFSDVLNTEWEEAKDEAV